MDAGDRLFGWLMALGILALLSIGVVTGLTTHRSNIERQQHDRDVKIACVQSGEFSSADCHHIVGYDSVD